MCFSCYQCKLKHTIHYGLNGYSNVFCSHLELTQAIYLFLLISETAVDRQISFPLSSVLHANGERNGQPLLHDFTEDIQFMDIEETSGKEQFSVIFVYLYLV